MEPPQSPGYSPGYSTFTHRNSLTVDTQRNSLTVVEVPLSHQCVMFVIDTWVSVCIVDLECSTMMRRETKDFLQKLSSLGPEYKMWCQRLKDRLTLEVGHRITQQ